MEQQQKSGRMALTGREPSQEWDNNSRQNYPANPLASSPFHPANLNYNATYPVHQYDRPQYPAGSYSWAPPPNAIPFPNPYQPLDFPKKTKKKKKRRRQSSDKELATERDKIMSVPMTQEANTESESSSDEDSDDSEGSLPHSTPQAFFSDQGIFSQHRSNSTPFSMMPPSFVGNHPMPQSYFPSPYYNDPYMMRRFHSVPGSLQEYRSEKRKRRRRKQKDSGPRRSETDPERVQDTTVLTLPSINPPVALSADLLPEKPRGNSSKYRGVSWHKRDKSYVTRVWIAGKSEHVGMYKEEMNAAVAFDDKMIALTLPSNNLLNFKTQLERDLVTTILSRYKSLTKSTLEQAYFTTDVPTDFNGNPSRLEPILLNILKGQVKISGIDVSKESNGSLLQKLHRATLLETNNEQQAQRAPGSAGTPGSEKTFTDTSQHSGSSGQTNNQQGEDQFNRSKRTDAPTVKNEKK